MEVMAIVITASAITAAFGLLIAGLVFAPWFVVVVLAFMLVRLLRIPMPTQQLDTTSRVSSDYLNPFKESQF
jgi:uncharacterized membrane protein